MNVLSVCAVYIGLFHGISSGDTRHYRRSTQYDPASKLEKRKLQS